jgi:dipeptidyl aminopeptidase/acylaminoacyl peptidase
MDADGGERQVTDANPRLRGVALAATRPVTAGEHGGVPVQGWVTAFDGPNGRPLVVSVHGGPHYPAGWRFSFEAQRLAARGYAVLTANPAGSGGYGRGFATAIRGGWGGADWASLERLIDAVAAEPVIDADRVAITGVSYGGYLSMQAITRSARFSAAISENGISNLLAEWGAEDDGGAWLTAELGGPPWERPEAYVASSPIAAANRIRTPLLLIHAELDRNCPIGQSEQMLAALRSLGRDVEFVMIGGEGHLMNLTGRPSGRLRRARAVDRWLGRYLRPEGTND